MTRPAGGSDDLGPCHRGALEHSPSVQCISSLGSADSAYSSHDVEAALAYVAAEKPAREWQVPAARLSVSTGSVAPTSSGAYQVACCSDHVETACAVSRCFCATQGLSRYRHVRELQAGSTAVVHLVEDKHSGKPCAVKLLERSSCDLGTAREVGL